MLILATILFSLLSLASLTVEWQLTRHRSSENLNNRKRIFSWWLITLICVTLLLVGQWAIALFILLLLYWAGYELARLIGSPFNFGWHTALIACLSLAQYLFIVVNEQWNLAWISFAMPFVMIAAGLRMTSPGRTLALSLFCILALQSLIIITFICTHKSYDYRLTVFILLALTSVNDIAQYIAGRLFGKHPLAPTLSPNKTIEGALGGLIVTTILGSILFAWGMQIEIWRAIIASGFISLLGIGGDLSISSLKRRAGLKNSGDSIPGHGGLLDRIDSLSFTGPGFGLCLVIFM